MSHLDGVWVVERESADGLETDVFTDAELAQQWATVCGGFLHSEPIIDSATLSDMILSYKEDDDE